MISEEFKQSTKTAINNLSALDLPVVQNIDEVIYIFNETNSQISLRFDLKSILTVMLNPILYLQRRKHMKAMQQEAIESIKDWPKIESPNISQVDRKTALSIIQAMRQMDKNYFRHRHLETNTIKLTACITAHILSISNESTGSDHAFINYVIKKDSLFFSALKMLFDEGLLAIFGIQAQIDEAGIIAALEAVLTLKDGNKKNFLFKSLMNHIIKDNIFNDTPGGCLGSFPRRLTAELLSFCGDDEAIQTERQYLYNLMDNQACRIDNYHQEILYIMDDIGGKKIPSYLVNKLRFELKYQKTLLWRDEQKRNRYGETALKLLKKILTNQPSNAHTVNGIVNCINFTSVNLLKQNKKDFWQQNLDLVYKLTFNSKIQKEELSDIFIDLNIDDKIERFRGYNDYLTHYLSKSRLDNNVQNMFASEQAYIEKTFTNPIKNLQYCIDRLLDSDDKVLAEKFSTFVKLLQKLDDQENPEENLLLSRCDAMHTLFIEKLSWLDNERSPKNKRKKQELEIKKRGLRDLMKSVESENPSLEIKSTDSQNLNALLLHSMLDDKECALKSLEKISNTFFINNNNHALLKAIMIHEKVDDDLFKALLLKINTDTKDFLRVATAEMLDEKIRQYSVDYDKAKKNLIKNKQLGENIAGGATPEQERIATEDFNKAKSERDEKIQALHDSNLYKKMLLATAHHHGQENTPQPKDLLEILNGQPQNEIPQTTSRYSIFNSIMSALNQISGHTPPTKTARLF